jgi:hypothetical protein
MPEEFLEFFGSMINEDDARHARLRRIVSRGFTQRRIAALHDQIETAAARIVDDVRGECVITDIVQTLLSAATDLRGSGQPQRLTSIFINGIKHLPATFTPGGTAA